MKRNRITEDKTGCPVGLTRIVDDECEKMVLHELTMCYQSIIEVESILSPECFHNLLHREIYKSIMVLYGAGERINLVALSAQLNKQGISMDRLELIDLINSAERAYDILPSVFRLKELAYRRRLWEMSMELSNASCDPTQDLEKIYNELKESVDNLFDGNAQEIETLGDTYRKLQNDMLLNRDREPGEIAGTPTGFEYLDANGGLMGGDLIVIGAETSQGKTSLATAMTLAALKHSHKVGFYSLEMMPKQVVARMASMETGINAKDISNGRLELYQIYQIDAEMEKIGLGNLFFDGRSISSLSSILCSIRRLKMKHDIKGAVVDYIQLVKVDEKGLSREQEVAKIARDLKNLAKELDIWIIGISQLSRAERGMTMPMMCQLRDSGQIEQAADTVILIHRPLDGKTFPAPYSDINPRGKALIKIAKGRNTGVGEFICGFRPQNTLFFPLNPSDLHGNPENQSPFEDDEELIPF